LEKLDGKQKLRIILLRTFFSYLLLQTYQ